MMESPGVVHARRPPHLSPSASIGLQPAHGPPPGLATWPPPRRPALPPSMATRLRSLRGGGDRAWEAASPTVPAAALQTRTSCSSYEAQSRKGPTWQERSPARPTVSPHPLPRLASPAPEPRTSGDPSISTPSPPKTAPQGRAYSISPPAHLFSQFRHHSHPFPWTALASDGRGRGERVLVRLGVGGSVGDPVPDTHPLTYVALLWGPLQAPGTPPKRHKTLGYRAQQGLETPSEVGAAWIWGAGLIAHPVSGTRLLLSSVAAAQACGPRVARPPGLTRAWKPGSLSMLSPGF